MSRFTGEPLLAKGVVGNTATALQIEALANLTSQYLVRAYPPARLRASDAADLLGFHEDDMAILVREKLITPLGVPTHNAVKYFALADVEALGRDVEALSKATAAIYSRNHSKTSDRRVDSQHAKHDLIQEIVVRSN